MRFLRSRPDVVRSHTQSWLINDWNDRRNGSALPLWHDLAGEAFAEMTDNLSYTDVVASGTAVRFLIRYHGKRIAETFGGICEGRFLDEILPESYRAVALSTYQQVVATALPVYTIADMRNHEGRIVHFERLLLPFGSDGVTVERILASLEIVSPEGAFDHRELMKMPGKPPIFAFMTTIQR